MFSGILRFYRLHLSQYLVFRVLRVLAEGFYRSVYRAYCHVKPTAYVARFDLTRFSCYMGDHLVTRFPVFSAQSTNIPAPVFLNDLNGIINSTPHTVAIELPKIDVVELNDAAVVGGSDFILAGKAALAPDCFVEFSDTCPANVFGVTAIDHSKQTLQLFIADQGIAIEAGISLLGQNTTNYAHWLTETLPKLTVLDAFPQYDDFPLLVDGGLHRNIYDSISAVSGKKRQLILVERWQHARVRRLVCVSQPGYEPYIPHGLLNTGTPRIVNSFSAPALAALHAAVQDTRPPPDPRNCEKIFLCRNDRSNNLRGLANSIDIEALLRKKGYILVDPAKLSFIEQVQACHAAKIIVTPIGAALANMIFASAGCQILALSPYYENANYYFYSNLAAVLKLRFSYLLGRQSDQRGHPMHRSYSVDLVLLERVLDSLSER